MKIKPFMEYLVEVLGKSLKIYSKAELNKMLSNQLKILQTEDSLFYEKVFSEYKSCRSRAGYVKKSDEILILAQILSWRVSNRLPDPKFQ